jgi:hypothetical protein
MFKKDVCEHVSFNAKIPEYSTAAHRDIAVASIRLIKNSKATPSKVIRRHQVLNTSGDITIHTPAYLCRKLKLWKVKK